jgi:hypothetical protein
MTDKQFILFLSSLLTNDLFDGTLPDEEDFQTIKNEFESRGWDEDYISIFENY